MPTLVIMRGVPGSGKSTTAKAILKIAANSGQTAVICSNDDYPGYYDNPEGKYDWSPKKCNKAIDYCRDKFKMAIQNRVDVIILDNTNVTRKAFGYYEEIAQEEGYEVVFNQNVPQENPEYIETCAKRNLHGVNAGIIRSMIKNWEKI